MASLIRSRKFSLALLGIVTLLLQLSIKDALAEMQTPAVALENADAKLTIVIPDHDEIYVTIRRDNGSDELKDVLYAFSDSVSLNDEYQPRLIVTDTLSPRRRLDITLKDVVADDAGTYRCYPGATSTTTIPNCGQKLIIIRKPNQPTIKLAPSSSLLEGSNLQLVCETDSTSLPPDHGMSSKIWWEDENGQFVGVPGRNSRISINGQNQLVLENIERSDKGLKFVCRSADNSGDDDQLISDPSPIYEVIPEFKPERKDLTLTPDFDHNSILNVDNGGRLMYSCDAVCEPACEVNWQFLPPNNTGRGERFADMSELTDPKTLDIVVTRHRHGSYRCKAENIHGVVYKRFSLNVAYMSAPKVYINGQQRNSSRLVEDEKASLQCVFDCNPQPIVRWRSPSQGQLKSEPATGPREEVEDRILKHLYTSSYTLEQGILKCEDGGIYTCLGVNEVTSAEGRMQLLVMCPPSSAGIEGLELKSEYVWEIPHRLSFDFVLRASPEPKITRIMSSGKGGPRQEKIPDDIAITTEKSYNGKPYLTRFTLASRRQLDQSDTDRTFTMSVESTEFRKDFYFTIRPRGPPHEVYNVTAIEVDHNSVNLFWMPGFDGGERQTFTIQHRPKNKEGAAWKTAMENVPEDKAVSWTEVEVTSLRPNTEYALRVIAFNVLGNATSAEITFKTLAVPDDSLGAVAIVGIIFAVIIIIIIILVLLYIFVFRKRWAKDPEKNSDPVERIRERIAPLLSSMRKNKDKEGQNGNAAPANAEPKEGILMKMRNKFKRNSEKEYKNVPAKDYSEQDDDDDWERENDEDYINTAMIKKPDNKEVIYENTPMNNNADGDGKDKPDSKKKKDGELQYVTVEFTDDGKSKIVGDKKGKKPKPKPKPKAQPEDSVDYSDIDFVRTEQMKQKMQQESRPDDADGDLAVDGGANDGGADNSGRPKRKEEIDPRNYGADFGTTV